MKGPDHFDLACACLLTGSLTALVTMLVVREGLKDHESRIDTITKSLDNLTGSVAHMGAESVLSDEAVRATNERLKALEDAQKVDPSKMQFIALYLPYMPFASTNWPVIVPNGSVELVLTNSLDIRNGGFHP